jgi:hypothetical protein
MQLDRHAMEAHVFRALDVTRRCWLVLVSRHRHLHNDAQAKIVKHDVHVSGSLVGLLRISIKLDWLGHDIGPDVKLIS